MFGLMAISACICKYHMSRSEEEERLIAFPEPAPFSTTFITSENEEIDKVISVSVFLLIDKFYKATF